MKKTASLFVVYIFSALLFSPLSQANNLAVSNVRMGPRDLKARTISVLFDLSWDNSWRTKINHDAVWLAVRLQDAQSPASEKRLCKLSTSGLNSAGTSAGQNSSLEVYVPQDKLGAFVRRSQNQEISSVSAQSLMLTVNYDSCGLSENSQIGVMLSGLEMVFVPEGAFYAGDFTTSAASFRQGSSDDQPWYISGESALDVTAASSGGYYYTSAGNAGEFATGSAFSVPATFPKGFSSFYVMKYEISEGDWVAFIDSLPPAARVNHDITDNRHKNSDSVASRNTVSCSGSPLVCTTLRPSRPVSYLSWGDLCAFLDWAGLRPMSELEFEKLARGPLVPLKGDFAWGSTDITATDALSGTNEDGQETVVTQGANARFNNVLLAGGDSLNGPEYQSGPVRSGIFATSTSDRVASGAGYYGAMELSGDLKEMVVTLGNGAGLVFTASQGDGYLTTATGFEGNADVPGWPGMDVDAAKGISSGVGAGFRGGSWADAAGRLRVSDRQEAALVAENALATFGGRGARTSDGK